MKKAKQLNRMWARGNRAAVLKALTAGNRLDVRTLTLMLDDRLNAHRETFRAWLDSVERMA